MQTMIKISKATTSKEKPQEESLKVNLSKRSVRMHVRMFKFRDKDTRQIIMYMPSLEITGYGADEKKAFEMLDFSIREYFDFLLNLKSYHKLEEELTKLGWKHTPRANKEFSKAFVSSDGELKNFNAVADEVEELTVQA